MMVSVTVFDYYSGRERVVVKSELDLSLLCAEIRHVVIQACVVILASVVSLLAEEK